MSAATIVFTDIVGFSQKPTDEQRKLIESLTAEVVHEIRTLLFPPLDSPSVTALPTGDGLALAFLHRPNKPWDRQIIFTLILKLHRWAEGRSTVESRVELRVGVHVGPVELVTDINNRPNVCGDTVNYAQRVMDAARPRQTLFSDTAVREYVGAQTAAFISPPFSSQMQGRILGPIEVLAKHGLQIPVYKLILEPSQTCSSNDDPEAKGWMLVTLTPLPKEIVGSFSEQLEKAKQIAFIQLTGDRLLSQIEEGTIEFSQDLHRFWVFMPAPQAYASLQLPRRQPSAPAVEEAVRRWRDFLVGLRQRLPDADIKLGLFNEPPFLGASFIDWEQPRGKIHVSPYVWNVATPNCPGYDVSWVGSRPSEIYETYVQGLEYLRQTTTNELD